MRQRLRAMRAFTPQVTAVILRIARVAAIIPPLILAGLILFLWFSWVELAVGIVFDAGKEYQGRLFVVSQPNRVVIAVATVCVHTLLVPLALTFWRVTTVPPGGVPAWYKQRNRGYLLWQQNLLSWRAARAAERAATRAMPAYLRGRVGHGGTDGDEDDEYDGRVPTAAHDSNTQAQPALVQVQVQDDNEAETAPLTADASANASMSVRDGAGMARMFAQASDNGSSCSLTSLTALAAACTSGGQHTEAWQPSTHAVPLMMTDEVLLRPGPLDPHWCRKCAAIKPPRTHHCSLCGTCQLKMDHHCPWVGQCVGYANYKFFYLLLFYGWLLTLLVTVIWTPIIAGFWRLRDTVVEDGSAGSGSLLTAPPGALIDPYDVVNREFTFGHGGLRAVLAYACCASLAVSLALFAGMHTWLLLRNATTLEGQSSYYNNPYASSRGMRDNFEAVMGVSKRWWFWPWVPAAVLSASHGGTDFRAFPSTPSAIIPPPICYPYGPDDIDAATMAAAERAAGIIPLRIAQGGEGGDAASEFADAEEAPLTAYEGGNAGAVVVVDVTAGVPSASSSSSTAPDTTVAAGEEAADANAATRQLQRRGAR